MRLLLDSRTIVNLNQCNPVSVYERTRKSTDAVPIRPLRTNTKLKIVFNRRRTQCRCEALTLSLHRFWLSRLHLTCTSVGTLLWSNEINHQHSVIIHYSPCLMGKFMCLHTLSLHCRPSNKFSSKSPPNSSTSSSAVSPAPTWDQSFGFFGFLTA